MKRLKMKLFVSKYRTEIGLALIIVLGIIITLGILKIDSNKLAENPTLFGVMGTLMGAIIGGVLSLIGSIWVNSKQQRALQNIKRKNIIYNPLYDELVDIHNNILQQNPYPDYIAFKKGAQTMLPHPQFSAWGRIKSDARYLDVPDILIKQMEKLEESIHSYYEIRNNADEKIQNVLNDILSDNDLNDRRFANVSNMISGDILSNKKIDLHHKVIGYRAEEQRNEVVWKRINDEIYDRCNCIQIVIEIRKKYEDWLIIQEQSIEMLGLLIKQVLVQYKR